MEDEPVTSVDFVFTPPPSHPYGRRRKREAGLRRCVNISILADDVVETDEYFTLVLSSEDLGVTLMPANATVVISNNDCEFTSNCFVF